MEVTSGLGEWFMRAESEEGVERGDRKLVSGRQLRTGHACVLRMWGPEG